MRAPMPVESAPMLEKYLRRQQERCQGRSAVKQQICMSSILRQPRGGTASARTRR